MLNIFWPVFLVFEIFDNKGLPVAVVTQNAVVGPYLHEAVVLDIEALSTAYLL